MRNSPRRLGLLGGITWHSSLIYERLINEGIANALPSQSADLLVRSYNFGEIARLQAEGGWDALGRILAGDARWLRDGGAEAIIICANTMHLVADDVGAAVDIPVINVIDVTAQAILAAGLDTAALLGTGFTMREPFYRDRMAANGVTTLAPEQVDLDALHHLIYSELARGNVPPEAPAFARGVAERVLERGAQGVIAGCTEIPMVLTQSDLDVPYFDSLELHAQAAVEFALADETPA